MRPEPGANIEPPEPGDKPDTDRKFARREGDPGLRRDGIIAYHGSPHDFDRFDISKIGTGEGAQAYGYGLYFAGNETVARNYRDALASPPNAVVAWHGIEFDPERAGGHVGTAGRLLIMYGGDYDGALRHAAEFAEPGVSRVLDVMREGARVVTNGPSPGRMYQVRLNVEPEQLLDWDQPLMMQPESAQAMLRQELASSPYAPAVTSGKIAGGNAYKALAARLADPDRVPRQYADPIAASRALTQAGIQGIRYLDAGSRTTGEGSHNYVMFSDEPIDPGPDPGLRKYSLRDLLASGQQAAVRAQAKMQPMADDLRQLVFPLSAGVPFARTSAHRFANASAEIAFRGARMDELLKREFTPEQRKRMWDALDDQSLFEQNLREQLQQVAPAQRPNHHHHHHWGGQNAANWVGHDSLMLSTQTNPVVA